MKGLKFEEINVMEQTQHKKSFSGKADRKAWTAFLIIVLIAITFVLISVFFYLWMKENKEVIQDVSHYEKILGEKGKYKNNSDCRQSPRHSSRAFLVKRAKK